MALTEWYVSTGAAAHADNGGGANASYAGTVAQLMAADDGPIVNQSSCSGVAGDPVVITKAGEFGSVQVGMRVKLVSGTNTVPGWYDITACDSDTISIATGAATGNGADWVVRIGGALTWAGMSTRMSTQGGGVTLANPGDRYNIATGTYTLTATDTWLADGSATSPIVLRGVTTAWVPITPTRTNGSGALVTTNYPVVAYNGNYQFNASQSNYSIFQAISVSASVAGSSVAMGNYCLAYGVNAINSANSASAYGLRVGIGSSIVTCDAQCTGPASAGGFHIIGSYSRAVGSVAKGTTGNGFYINGVACFVANCVSYGHSLYGVYITSNSPCSVVNCTIYGGKGVGFDDTAFLNPHLIICNHITDGSAYAIQGPASNSVPAILIHNRTRDNTSGAISWNGDWGEATTFGHVTTDEGDYRTDYVDALTGNFQLLRDAAGVGQGIMGSDIGAIQRPDPSIADPTYLLAGATAGDTGQLLYGNVTLPLEANVWYGSGAFGARYLYLGYRLGTIGTDGGRRYFTSYRSTLPASVVVGSWINVNGKYAQIDNIDGVELRLDNVPGDFPADGAGYMAGFYTAIAGSTPSKRASSIVVTNGAGPTLSAPDIKLNVIVDDLTGSLSGGGLTAQELRNAMELSTSGAIDPNEIVDTAQEARDAMELESD